jgi:hypothetical protein
MPMLIMHPLVRDVGRRQADPMYFVVALSLLHAAMNEARIGSPEEPANWPAWQSLIPHAVRVYEEIGDLSLGSALGRKTVDALAQGVGDSAGRFLRSSGDYSGSKRIYEEMAQRSLPSILFRRRQKLDIRMEVASAIGDAGDAAAARDRLAELLPLIRRARGAEHRTTLTARNNLASWTGEAGDPVAARDQFAALVPVRERVLGAEHPDTLAARGNLAAWTGHAGDPVAARDQFAALVPVRERVLGAEHPDTLLERNNLAAWTGRAGDPVAARDQLAALLPVAERVLGAEHRHTVTVRTNLNGFTEQAKRRQRPGRP